VLSSVNQFLQQFLGVEKITAALPRKVGQHHERVDQVEKGPRDDDAVIDVQKENHGHGGVAHTCENIILKLQTRFRN